MALLNRERPNNIIPPPQPTPELRGSSRPGLIALIVYGLGALVIAILLVFGVRWIYRSVTNNPTAVPPPATKISQNYPKQSTQQPQPSPAPSPSPGKSSTPSPAPSQLPSNGPGEVVALFIGSSLLAGWLHYKVTSVRQSD